MSALTPEEVQHIRQSAEADHRALHIPAQHRDHIVRLCDTIDALRAGPEASDSELLARLETAVTEAHQEGRSGVCVDLPTADDLVATLRRRPGKVLWRGKTGPLPGVDNERVSLITAEIAPGTEVAVVLTGEDGDG